jgi:hypothetical protein
MRKVMCGVVAAGAVVALAGCGGGSSAEDTAKAFATAVKTNNASNICKYIHWTNTSSGGCVDNLSQALASPQGRFSGTLSIGNVVTSGNQALAVSVGNFSFAGQHLTNTNANAGLPANGVTFAQAYANASDNPTSPDIQLVKVDNKWLVSLNGS